MKLKESFEALAEKENCLHLMITSRKAVVILWFDYDIEKYIANFRMGSGRHHTLVWEEDNKPLDYIREKLEPEKIELVGLDGAEEVEF